MYILQAVDAGCAYLAKGRAPATGQLHCRDCSARREGPAERLKLACLQDSLDSVEGFDARVIQCLQDYRDELVEPACKEQVHVLTKRASQDIRFDEPLADACYEDRARLCDGVQPVSVQTSYFMPMRFSISMGVACGRWPMRLKPTFCRALCKRAGALAPLQFCFASFNPPTA